MVISLVFFTSFFCQNGLSEFLGPLFAIWPKNLCFQVYFPIVFSEFSPDTWSSEDRQYTDVFNYGRRRGYFRHFGFGLASMYRSDLDLVGGINTTIQVICDSMVFLLFCSILLTLSCLELYANVIPPGSVVTTRRENEMLKEMRSGTRTTFVF